MATLEGRNIRPRRSFLFVPGTGPEMFPKALQAKPDIVCVDLEDAVIPEHKAQARRATLALFARGAGRQRSPSCWSASTRSAARDGIEDVAAILAAPFPPPGVMLPKVKTPDEVRLLDDMLEAEGSPLRLQIIIETNEGLEACREIAQASDRIDCAFVRRRRHGGGAARRADLERAAVCAHAGSSMRRRARAST